MTNQTITHALVRPPGKSFEHTISSTNARIDVALALKQHALYCDVLRAAGLTVEMLPASEEFPDSCFMQDPALIVKDIAVKCRMGAPTRAGEPGLIEDWLTGHFVVEEIIAPGTLEGGDVLLTPNAIFVGESARTNAAGIARLKEILEPREIRVEPIRVNKFLHLLTAATYVGNNTLLALKEFAGHPAFAEFDILRVSKGDAYAADALGIGENVVLPAGYPRVEKELQARGFRVLAVPMSEFEKADGGVTCLALVW